MIIYFLKNSLLIYHSDAVSITRHFIPYKRNIYSSIRPTEREERFELLPTTSLCQFDIGFCSHDRRKSTVITSSDCYLTKMFTKSNQLAS